MSRAPSPEAAALARLLFRLARTGAYARPAAHMSCYHVLSPRNDFAAPVAEIPHTAIRQARELGWLTPFGTEGRLQLSKAGRRALKREITANGDRATSAPLQRPRVSPRRKTDATAARTPQRIEGPLMWLRNRKDRSGQPLLTQAQYEAGTRFAADYAKGQMQPRVTASWSVTAPCMRSGTPGAGVDVSDAALAARNRFYAAMAVVGPDMGQVLIDVCCHDIGLESAERARRWPIRSGKVVLDIGLTALARHYGLEAQVQRTPVPPAASPAKARRWADPAFTPTLSGWTVKPAAGANPNADATASA